VSVTHLDDFHAQAVMAFGIAERPEALLADSGYWSIANLTEIPSGRVPRRTCGAKALVAALPKRVVCQVTPRSGRFAPD
jgi:hypothetical protein